MGDVPVAFPFAAGLVATVNPCGFALLPAYLSYFMGLEDGDDAGRGSRSTAVTRGLVVSGVMSLGFLTVFGMAGTVVSAGFRSVVIDYIPWLSLLVGIAIAMLGLAMLVSGFEITPSLPHLNRGGRTRGYGSVYVFGVSYAVASLSCALPVFLTVIGAATTAPTFAGGVATFLVYALGMSMLMGVVTLALALAKVDVVERIRGLRQHVSRISGAILVLAGGYITFYWIANLNDPLAARGGFARVVEGPQTWLTSQLGDHPERWAIVFSLVLVAAIGYVILYRARHRSGTLGTDMPDMVGAGEWSRAGGDVSDHPSGASEPDPEGARTS